MRQTLLITFALFFTGSIHATDPEDIFSNKSPLTISIITNPELLFADRQEKDYHSASLAIRSDDWVIQGKSEIRLAGNSRLTLCDRPPLKVRLNDLEQPWPNKLKKVKIVSTCKEKPEFEQFLYKEYLSYKAYNLITPYSYQVRLANIEIRDKEGNLYAEYTGFLLEPDHHMEERLGIEEIKTKEMSSGELAKIFHYEKAAGTLHTSNFLAFFQFMIANTDWNVHTRQNIKIFAKNDTIYPVPFDFDYSGLVDAPYSVPAETLPISDVNQRFYQGLFYDYEALIPIRNHYNTIEEDLYELLDEVPLTRENRHDCQKLIRKFYRIVNNEDRFRKFIRERDEYYDQFFGSHSFQDTGNLN